jgi:hypothetical protein
MCLAVGANVGLANLDFEGRDQRSDKLELTDGTNIFAEARALKECVDGKGCKEIADGQPGRPNWLVPEAKDFVAPKKQSEQCNTEPF